MKELFARALGVSRALSLSDDVVRGRHCRAYGMNTFTATCGGPGDNVVVAACENFGLEISMNGLKSFARLNARLGRGA